MTLQQFLQVALLSGTFALLLGWLLLSCAKPLLRRLDRLLPPRHLKLNGVRRRSAATHIDGSRPHEPD